MEDLEVIDKNLVMLESMVRIIIYSPSDTPFESLQGTLWAMEEKLLELKGATANLQKPLLQS